MQDLGSVMKRNRGVKRSSVAAMKRELERMFLGGDQRIQVAYMVQKRPYTLVELVLVVGLKRKVSGHGFTKVQGPDRWSETRGVTIAVSYALNDMVEALLYNGVQDKEMFDLIIGNGT